MVDSPMKAKEVDTGSKSEPKGRSKEADAGSKFAPSEAKEGSKFRLLGDLPSLIPSKKTTTKALNLPVKPKKRTRKENSSVIPPPPPRKQAGTATKKPATAKKRPRQALHEVGNVTTAK